MYAVLHIPTGKFLFNDVLNSTWCFSCKRVADQLVDDSCQVNLLSGWGSIRRCNLNVDWDNFSLTEFEIVEVPYGC